MADREVAEEVKPRREQHRPGRVRIQARPILRIVVIWMPDLLAHMVPATPEERTWVVLTGRPATSASPMVAMATSSALAPWA